jgi:NAD(P)-dependent dehydrogenase (short-subunit alcohol dehydrogenase family)
LERIESVAVKSVIITGAASGLGATCARSFADDEAGLILVDRNEALLAELASELSGKAEIIPIIGDVTQSALAEKAVTAALDAFGQLDVLVNNAGIDPLNAKAALETSDDQWHMIMGVNVTGAFFFSRAAIKAMKANGGGSIVNVASVSALKPSPEETAYSVSKAALLHLTKCIALDYAGDNIRANCVCPGMLESIMGDRRAQMTENAAAARSRAASSVIPLGREGQYSEMARIVRFLADPEQSGYMTGANLVADGGYLLA